jgi:type I restriction enzyme R subunit
LALGAEKPTVQERLIHYAKEAGWKHIPRHEAQYLRQGENGLVLYDVMVKQLQKLNPGVVDHLIAEHLVNRLMSVPATVGGNCDAQEYLKGIKTISSEAENRERKVKLLDQGNIHANVFHVTDKFSYANGTQRIEADVVFMINGVPVILVETKTAAHLEGISEALDRVERYHGKCPELMSIVQLFALVHLGRLYYGATWSTSRHSLFEWRGEQAGGDFESVVKTFVNPSTVLRFITDFILFFHKGEVLQKIVLRPHQMRAVERVQERAVDPEKRRGLIWHTQGSGKTFTMIMAGKKLLEDQRFENPTVLMIVDRTELEAQLFTKLEGMGFRTVQVAGTKRRLRELLEANQPGIIVSMIREFDYLPANLNLSENIFVLVDEAHRSMGGNLGNYLMGALPNATYVGFTGTPVDKSAHGRNTFRVFGRDDKRGYLDKYTMQESIEDGTTVPLHYALAKNDLLVNKEALEEEFLGLVDLEGVSDTREVSRVLSRAVTLRNELKNPERISKVAQLAANHFRNAVESMGYKAFLVATDREACALYKKELDKHLPSDYSEVVISASRNDPPELATFHLRENEEQRVISSFGDSDEKPKILIVTERLLTGFDASVLYCMYLDKPMRDHVLLQATARVNRPYEDRQGRRKTAGFVLDFVGIFDYLERALAFDSEDVSGVAEGIDVLQRRFAKLATRGNQEYLSVWTGLEDEAAAEIVLEHFRDKDRRGRFYRFFRKVEELYEVLSPDPYLRPYLDNYEKLARIYRLLRATYESSILVDKSLLRKTGELVKAHTETSMIFEPQDEHDLTPETLKHLATGKSPETVRVLNVLKTIRTLVEQKGAQLPYLIPIGERAEAIAEAFEQRQKTTQEALQELYKLAEEYEKADDREVE